MLIHPNGDAGHINGGGGRRQAVGRPNSRRKPRPSQREEAVASARQRRPDVVSGGRVGKAQCTQTPRAASDGCSAAKALA